MAFYLTDESVLAIMATNSFLQRKPQANSKEERMFLRLHYLKHCNYSIDNNAYLMSDNQPIQLLPNTIYTHVSFNFQGHSSSPDLVIVHSNQIELANLCISYHPMKEPLIQLSLAQLLCLKLGYEIQTTKLLCINSKFNLKTTNAYFFKPIVVSNKTNHIVAKLKPYLTSQAPLPLKPTALHHETTAIFQLNHLSYKKKQTYFSQGIRSFHNILDQIPDLTRQQKRQCEVELSNTPFVDYDALRLFFAKLSDTIQFFDIEACQFPYPLFFTTHPFETFPFLFSVHRYTIASEQESHRYTFFYPDSDFRRLFAEALIQQLDASQTIIIFDPSLEKIIFKSLANAFPDLAKQLLLRMNNFLDISTLFINHHVVIPGMKGKYSLKHIINAIQDKTLYDELSIQSGFHAAHAYKYLYYQKNYPNEAVKNEIVAYAKSDTKSLLIIYNFLRHLYSKKCV